MTTDRTVEYLANLVRVNAGAICTHDPEAAPKMKKYVPFWAKPESGELT